MTLDSSGSVGRVGVLAPMTMELASIVRTLSLIEVQANVWRGVAGSVEVVASMTTIGMQPAREAAHAMLEHDVGHVMIVGIAGAVSNEVTIGSMVYPQHIIDRATSEVFTPMALHGEGIRLSGAISCGDDLITDEESLAALDAAGVIALDMESAAVGSVCEGAGMGWSVWRSISDHAGGGLIDPELFAMTHADGSADPEALQRALADPKMQTRLAQLGHDATRAAERAAAQAIAAMLRF